MGLRCKLDYIFSYKDLEIPISHKKLAVCKRSFIEKSNKRDCSLVKSYKSISLLDCLGMILEKFVVDQLSQFCEDFGKFHKEQIRVRKRRSTIDTATILVQ